MADDTIHSIPDSGVLTNLKISIIGLGLIGGSLARAFRERIGCRRIVAVNRNPHALQEALSDGSIDIGIPEAEFSRVFPLPVAMQALPEAPQFLPGAIQALLDCDIIFICTPVRQTTRYITLLAPHIKPGCIVTDVGSTKEDIVSFVAQMENPPLFIGGHPMAGAEKTGYLAGFAHLFENAYYVLTPPPHTADSDTTQHAIGLMTSIIQGIGAIPVLLDAAEHDRITGGISHVPHVIASGLVNIIHDMETADNKMQMLAAGGFRDITRIASSSPEMWENIVMSNKSQVDAILQKYVAMLETFRKNMAANDSAAILRFFDDARKFRDGLPAKMQGSINPLHEVVVDVVDKPGIIGEIATLLGNQGVNISNINITHNREFEQGCLRITFPDSASAGNAYDLLAKAGYKAFRKQ